MTTFVRHRHAALSPRRSRVRIGAVLVALGFALGGTAAPALAVGDLTVNGASAEERILLEQHWSQIVGAFPAQDACLRDLEVTVVDRAEDYTSRGGSIIAIYNLPGTIYIEHDAVFNGRTALHEMAHHLDSACDFHQTEYGDAFRVAQGLPLGTSWYEGTSWHDTPAEVFAEAVASLFGAAPRMDITAEAQVIVARWAGGVVSAPPAPEPSATEAVPLEVDEPGFVPLAVPVVLVDGYGRWWRYGLTNRVPEPFYFGDPGDVPFMGDWDCDGIETPGLYRQSDGFVYLRNSNTVGIADHEFFFGNPGDVPIVGDFDGDGCDTVSIWRPAEARIYVIDRLGADGGGLGAADYWYTFGGPGDVPFVGDFDGDGVDTVGFHRRSSGHVFFRNANSSGVADVAFSFGDPGDQVVVGDWDGDGDDTVGLYRPADGSVHLGFENEAGAADLSMQTLNTELVAAG